MPLYYLYEGQGTIKKKKNHQAISCTPPLFLHFLLWLRENIFFSRFFTLTRDIIGSVKIITITDFFQVDT